LPSLHNIKTEVPKVEESKQETSSETHAVSKAIDKNELKNAIQAYALDMRVKDRMFEYVLFNERDVDFDNGKLTFKLENELQKTQLMEYKPVFIDYLRNKFGSNFTIDAEIIAVVADTKKLLYTPTDKYKFMAEKFPELEELKKKLGLELEF
jgi:DNA polymerase III subunit gamma/tau